MSLFFSTLYSQQTVTISNNTPYTMHITYTVVVPPTCEDDNGQSGDDQVLTLSAGSSTTKSIGSTEVIDKVIATPDPFCYIVGQSGPCGQPSAAYYSAYSNCGNHINKCGCQYDVPGNCSGNPPTWCISVSGNLISVN